MGAKRTSVVCLVTLVSTVAIISLWQPSINSVIALQDDGLQPSTILILEVRSWCEADSDCASAKLEFVPGSGEYLDRVRMAPRSDVPYIAFNVPEGYSAVYWDDNGARQEAQGSATIRALEATFSIVK